MSYTYATATRASTHLSTVRSAAAPGRLVYVGHATACLELGGTTVITDPVLSRWIGPIRRHAPAADPSLLAAVDAVAVSHLHHDHLDLHTLRRLRSDAPVIVPRGAENLVRRAGVRDVRPVSAGEEVRVGEMTIRAVPAVHDPRRTPLGPRAEPVGFVFESAGTHAYFAGDTDLFEGMRELGPLDLALVPVWGWGPTLGEGHMDPELAARALELLRPRLAVPIHWGTYFPVGASRIWGDRLTDPPHEFERSARRHAPGVEVRILRPGEGLELGSSPRRVG